MADDNYQRPHAADRFGTAEPRSTPVNDPLAELARLIGQTDPFAEFGRSAPPQHQQPSAPPQQNWVPPAGPAPGYAAPPTVPGYEHGARSHDQYYDEPAPANFADNRHESPAFEPDYRDEARYGYDDGQAEQGEEVYDDIPPRRNRLGVIVVASVVTLAVVGTAVAFGYRALFGSSGAKPPPVIQADASPSKVVPPSKSEPSAGKQFNDRVGERSAGEKIVSREEQPMERPQPPAFAMPSLAQQAAAIPETPPAMQSPTEPKRVRTIAIKPDGQPALEPAAPVPPPPARAPAPRPAVQTQAAAQPAQRMAGTSSTPSADAEALVTSAPPPAPVQARPAPAPSRNAPLSLNPEGAPPPAPTRTASAPARVAPPPAAASAASGARYGVQVSSQRSEADAQAAFRALQAKYPAQLGSHQPVIRRADLGAKGIYYRAMVGFSNGADAVALCNSLKAAGGACIIQKN